MKKSKILITANSLEFLLNYKSLISKKFLKQGYEIYWNSPINELSNKKLYLIPKGIKYNFWHSSRKGIFVFIRMILSYCKFVSKGEDNNIPYCLFKYCRYFYFLYIKIQILKYVFVLIGPSRIRNSLRIRLLEEYIL